MIHGFKASYGVLLKCCRHGCFMDWVADCHSKILTHCGTRRESCHEILDPENDSTSILMDTVFCACNADAFDIQCRGKEPDLLLLHSSI